jgi:hypothetical protein
MKPTVWLAQSLLGRFADWGLAANDAPVRSPDRR